ncbi:hypothetical protein [Sphingobacterium detergens]|uniref:hypothetical protein n=1 Tax=Sphingobacterium detergens TaxID=1145106 RepID=UPI0011C35CD5|nr:hypothetical protein [Sphingobacterium detergens]
MITFSEKVTGCSENVITFLVEVIRIYTGVNSPWQELFRILKEVISMLEGLTSPTEILLPFWKKVNTICKRVFGLLRKVIGVYNIPITNCNKLISL